MHFDLLIQKRKAFMPHTLDRVFLVSVVVSSPIIQKESSISCQSVFTMPTSVESDEHYRFDCLPLCVVCAALEDPRGSNHETFVTGTVSCNTHQLYLSLSYRLASPQRRHVPEAVFGEGNVLRARATAMEVPWHFTRRSLLSY